MSEINQVEYLKAFEGVDGFGESKAVIVVQNLTFTMNIDDDTTDPTIHDQASTIYGIPEFAVNNGMMAVRITFEDFEDPDYLRMKDLCSQLSNSALDGLEHHLLMTVTDKSTHNYFMSIFLMTYIFDGLQAAITFIAPVKDVLFYQLPEEIKAEINEELKTEDDDTQDDDFDDEDYDDENSDLLII